MCEKSPSLLRYCLSKNTICAKLSPISDITTGASPAYMITSLAPTVSAAVIHTIHPISTTLTNCQRKRPNKYPAMHKKHKVDAYTRVKIGSVWNIYSCIHNRKSSPLRYAVQLSAYARGANFLILILIRLNIITNIVLFFLCPSRLRHCIWDVSLFLLCEQFAPRYPSEHPVGQLPLMGSQALLFRQNLEHSPTQFSP